MPNIIIKKVSILNHDKGERTTMDIHKVVCVGAGLIGQGWATLFSSAGLEVILQDVTETVLEKAIEGVKSNLIFLEAKSLLKQGEANAALKRIKTSRLIGRRSGKRITFKNPYQIIMISRNRSLERWMWPHRIMPFWPVALRDY